jgi:UDP-glucuronate decarboxylase
VNVLSESNNRAPSRTLGDRTPLPTVVAEDLQAIGDRIAPTVAKLGGATLLVTGAAGFLPSYVVDALIYANDHLLTEPCRIIGVDNFATGVPERLGHLQGRSDLALVRHDITEALSIDEPVHYIFHGASIASPTWFRRLPLETIDVNVRGTWRLLEFAVGQPLRGFLYLSSSGIYGDPTVDQVPTSEEFSGNVSPLGLRACYDESKRLAETICMTFFRVHGVPVRIARPFNVYGPRLRFDDGRVVPDFIRDAIAGKPITLYSSGNVTRSFCYVTDAVSGLILLLCDGAPGEAYNVGNDEEVTIRQLAETVDEASGKGLGVSFEVSEDAHYLTNSPQRRVPDLRKLKALGGWEPQIPLHEGIRRTYRFYEESV